MFFKNATVYQITRDLNLKSPESIKDLSEKLKNFGFKAVGVRDFSSFGWAPPVGSDFVLMSEGRILISAKKETKILPAATVNKELAIKVKELAEKEGRRIGKKEKESLKDVVTQDLLPKCFSKDKTTFGYIDTINNLLVIDSSSETEVDEFCALLRKSIDSLPIVPFNTVKPSTETMSLWIKSKEDPSGFIILNDMKLEGFEGDKASFKGQDLFCDEVINHLESMQVTEIRLDVPNKVSFTLTDDLKLRSIKWAQEFIINAAEDESQAVKDDADFFLMSSELNNIIKNLIEVMHVQLQEE